MLELSENLCCQRACIAPECDPSRWSRGDGNRFVGLAKEKECPNCDKLPLPVNCTVSRGVGSQSMRKSSRRVFHPYCEFWLKESGAAG